MNTNKLIYVAEFFSGQSNYTPCTTLAKALYHVAVTAINGDLSIIHRYDCEAKWVKTAKGYNQLCTCDHGGAFIEVIEIASDSTVFETDYFGGCIQLLDFDETCFGILPDIQMYQLPDFTLILQPAEANVDFKTRVLPWFEQLSDAIQISTYYQFDKFIVDNIANVRSLLRLQPVERYIQQYISELEALTDLALAQFWCQYQLFVGLTPVFNSFNRCVERGYIIDYFKKQPAKMLCEFNDKPNNRLF